MEEPQSSYVRDGSLWHLFEISSISYEIHLRPESPENLTYFCAVLESDLFRVYEDMMWNGV
jgi:hypothetical protein